MAMSKIKLIFFCTEYPGTDFWIGLKLKEAFECTNETCNNAMEWVESGFEPEEDFTFQSFMTEGVVTSESNKCIYTEGIEEVSHIFEFEYYLK